MALLNLVQVTTATTGQGTITLGAAVSGYLTMTQAGGVTGQTYSYAIADGSNSEAGTGVWTSGTNTLTRNVLRSTNSNLTIALSGTAKVYITALAEDLTVQVSNVSTQTVNVVAGSSGHRVLLCDYNSTGTQTVNLPTAVNNSTKLTFKKLRSTGTVLIDPSGTETIDGATTATLRSQYESITLVSDNANWVII